MTAVPHRHHQAPGHRGDWHGDGRDEHFELPCPLVIQACFFSQSVKKFAPCGVPDSALLSSEI
jgi:hypothetical protein